MTNRFLSYVLIGLMFFAFHPVWLSAQTNGSASPAEKVKANVLKRGTGEKAKVKVKLLNGSQTKGYISQAGDNSFTVTDSKTNQTTTMAYSEVKEVNGTGLSKGAKIAIFVGVGVVVIAAAVGYVAAHALDNFKF